MTCVHHWKLESPNGPTVRGSCQRCGAQRAFPTTSEAVVWQESSGTVSHTEVIKPGTETIEEGIRVVRR